MYSIGEEIAKITNPTPEVFDPEDEINCASSAKINSAFTQDTDVRVSDLRRRTAPLLEDRDPSYAGKKVSRQSLGHVFQTGVKMSKQESRDSISSSSFSTSGSEVEDDESPDDDLSDEDVSKFKELVPSHSINRIYEERQSVEHEALTEEDDDENENVITQQFSNIDVSSEIEKGHGVKNQKEIWNRLLETRIKLQKVLINANKLPQTTMWEELKDKGLELEKNLSKSSERIKKVMESFLSSNDELLKQNPEIGNSVSNIKSNSDEEICSDTDEDIKDADMSSSPEKSGEKRKYEDCGDVLAKRFKSLVPYRNSVIQKLDEKTHLTAGRTTPKSFNAFDNSALKQIEQILCDKSRLIRRTQLKRSLYCVLGKSEDVRADENSNVESSKQDILIKDHDPEIFDDDDFYRQILKDLIESKSFGMDPAIIRKQMEIQKVRNKMKRKVDTKASKGRRIRYDVHPKLVNFLAPLKTCHITELERENFPKCLFGGGRKPA